MLILLIIAAVLISWACIAFPDSPSRGNCEVIGGGFTYHCHLNEHEQAWEEGKLTLDEYRDRRGY